MDTDAVLGPVVVIVADIVAFYLVSRLGRRSKGTGVKYEPFTGGEPSIPSRGLYRSDLFMFALMFLVAEAFALFMAGSFAAYSPEYPLLFLLGGGSIITVVVWWFIAEGGGSL